MSQSAHVIKILYTKLNPIPKKIFTICNSLLRWNTSLPLPPGHSDSELAESFNIFFTSKISRIRSELKDLRIGPPDYLMSMTRYHLLWIVFNHYHRKK